MSNIVLPAVDSGLLLQKTVKITVVLALLCTVLFILAPVTVKTYAYKAFREFSKISMMWQTRNWNEIQGEHFLVRYENSDSKNAEMVLSTAEKSFRPVSQRFGFIPKEKTLIVVYPSKEALGKSFGWTADESAMGVYWAGVIRVLSPTVWVDEKDPEKMREVFESEGPIAHEYTHLMVDYIAQGNYPRWFTEGVAQFEEERLTGYQLDERDITHPGELYPLAKMDRDFDSLSDQNLAYYQSLQAVNYIVDRYGEERLQKILNDLGRGSSMEKSFKDNLGASMEQFEQNFRIWAVENA